MDLIIDAYGTFIGTKGERIALKLPAPATQKTKKRIVKEYPIRKLNKIVVLRPSSISMHAVQLAIEHDVDIVYLGKFGKPVGRIFSSDSRGIATVRRAQVITAVDPARSLYLARQIVRAKCESQIAYLCYLENSYGKDMNAHITQAKAVLASIDYVSDAEESRNRLLGIEGFVAERYWNAIRLLYKFPGRRPQGRDKFNSALNYGYGILYNEVERACLYVGLDPYVGLYHSERYGKPSLVLDMVEEFRVPVVDRAILPLFLSKQLGKKGDFELIARGEYQLSEQGKKKVVEAVFERLLREVRWKRKTRSVRSIVEDQNRSLSRYFVGKEKSYIPVTFEKIS